MKLHITSRWYPICAQNQNSNFIHFKRWILRFSAYAFDAKFRITQDNGNCRTTVTVFSVEKIKPTGDPVISALWKRTIVKPSSFHISDIEPNVNTRIRQRSVTEFLFKSIYGNETLNRSTIQRWVQRLQKGDFDLHDKERPGSVLKLLSELVYRKLCSKWVPKLLTREMMQSRLWFIVITLLQSVNQCNGPIKCLQSRKKPRLSLSKDKIIITVFWNQDGLIFMDMLERNASISKERYCKSLEKLKRAISTKGRA
ncbi:hypothetical protein LAZ67_2006287 [Cordylochernes scorpioides]|uniref:Uncharacterized protein n=1 Tax=Cordylochernes scorpioides TaxID=51811 RepID=A0ABY6K6Q2_9ARAC|nr:hypothetical protein LAZ67_2006287 [Cordylochernes scorpioides]